MSHEIGKAMEQAHPSPRRTSPPKEFSMKPKTIDLRSIRFGAVALSLFLVTTSAWAQFERVDDIPATEVFSVRANGDTIAAGVDTAIYVSTDAGKHWRRSAKPVNDVTSIESIWIRNQRLYVATFGQGVFVTDDLGATWQAFNQGLVGGLADSQLKVSDLQVRGDSLYAATLGAGVYVRSLAGPSAWHPFGDAFELNQASNVNDLALGGSRLLASAGSNGAVFDRDPGDPDWTNSNLDNVGIRSGLQAQTAAWTGTGWVVGALSGVFRSVAGSEPWTRAGLRLGLVNWTAFATQGHHLFAAFDLANQVVMGQCDDDGATWQLLESLPGAFVFDLAMSGNDLYAARADGLWRRSGATLSVPIGGEPKVLRFALAGPQPFGDKARLRFYMPEAGTASVEVFDVLGRRATDRVEEWWSSGPHEVALDARRLSPGVYTARLRAAGTSEVVRLVHLR
jgi:photosystem II stability/assembly factor-like uncharacterized protein